MSNNSFFSTVCEPYVFGPFGGSFLTICFLDLLLPVIGFLVLLTFGVARLWQIRDFPLRIRTYSGYQIGTLTLSVIECILPGESARLVSHS